MRLPTPANAGCRVPTAGAETHPTGLAHGVESEAVGVECHVVLHHCACEHCQLRFGGRHLLKIEDLDLADFDELHEVGVGAILLAVVGHPLAGLPKRRGHQLHYVVGCVLLRVFLRKVGHEMQHECNRALGEGIGSAAVGQAIGLLNSQAAVVVELVRLRPLGGVDAR